MRTRQNILILKLSIFFMCDRVTGSKVNATERKGGLLMKKSIFGNKKKKTGTSKIVDLYRNRFRIKENLNHYLHEDYKRAERTFIKLSLLGELP